MTGTVTSVQGLDGEARVTELSQMLGSESGATRTNALEGVSKVLDLH